MTLYLNNFFIQLTVSDEYTRHEEMVQYFVLWRALLVIKLKNKIIVSLQFNFIL